MPKHRLHIMGIAPGASLAPDLHPVLRSCGVVFVSPRLRPRLPDFHGAVFGLSPLGEALGRMRGELESTEVAVVVGGDPMFFGIGRRLSAEFGTEHLEIYPALSSIQIAFARLKQAWDDVHFVSLHGRNVPLISGLVLSHERVCILAGGANTPAAVARRLLEGGVTGYRACVAENLGEKDERIVKWALPQIAESEFSGMSLLILEREPHAPEQTRLGLKESDIIHSRGLITKDEVRAAVLHALSLPVRGVLWDIGAGSGSISIEAARICPELDIRSVERNPAEIENIRGNVQRFSCSGVTVVEGTAPEICENLPDPDRVFVGGSGGRLNDILKVSARRLRAGGRIVVTAVKEVTAREAPTDLLEHGLEVSSSRISVQRTRFTSDGEETSDLNPIHVISGRK